MHLFTNVTYESSTLCWGQGPSREEGTAPAREAENQHTVAQVYSGPAEVKHRPGLPGGGDTHWSCKTWAEEGFWQEQSMRSDGTVLLAGRGFLEAGRVGFASRQGLVMAGLMCWLPGSG